MSYFVFTEENEHYMDASARRLYGEYETYAEAVAAARQIVDSDLAAIHYPGMTAESLYMSYTHYGRTPTSSPTTSGSTSPRVLTQASAAGRCAERRTMKDE